MHTQYVRGATAHLPVAAAAVYACHMCSARAYYMKRVDLVESRTGLPTAAVSPTRTPLRQFSA